MTYLTLNRLVFAIAVVAVLTASAITAKADTLICQTIMETPPRVMVFAESEGDDGIRDINANISGFNTVNYRDGRLIYINSNAYICHEIMGSEDAKERQIVDQFVNMILGVAE